VKFGYAIVLALVALVAVTGFASADRLPQQVPENQIFTIDTLIDVTGAVSEESELSWTLDSQNWATTEIYPLDGAATLWYPSAEVATALNNLNADQAPVVELVNTPGLGYYIADLKISDWMLPKYIWNQHDLAGFTR